MVIVGEVMKAWEMAFCVMRRLHIVTIKIFGLRRNIDDRFGELLGSLGRLGRSFGIPSWTGNEPISRHPSCVPILDGLATHGAFKAADLARPCNVFAAARHTYRIDDRILSCPQYALLTVRFPVNNPATIKLTPLPEFEETRPPNVGTLAPGLAVEVTLPPSARLVKNLLQRAGSNNSHKG
jgi:hypothetical protein